jgi:hypothetical protein
MVTEYVFDVVVDVRDPQLDISMTANNKKANVKT